MAEIKVIKQLGEELNVDFVCKRMEEIHVENDGRADEAHRHNFYTVIFAEDVEGKHSIDFHDYAFQPPCVFFVSPGQVHQVETTSLPKGFVFLFKEDFLLKHDIRPSFISDLNVFRNYGESPPLLLDENRRRSLHNLANKINEASENQSTFHLDKVAAYLKLFLIECAETCSLPTQETQHSLGVESIIKRFRNLVDTNFRQEHSVSFYAESLKITTGHLNKTVKALTGNSAKDFVQKRISTEAKRLAIYSKLSTKEIGFELGFDDPAHFSSFFKKCTGQSFSSYRKALLAIA